MQRDAAYQPSKNLERKIWASIIHGLRDGWELVGLVKSESHKTYRIFRKTLWDGWILSKIAHAENDAPPGKGCYWDEHTLFHPVSKLLILCPQWKWAERDQNRLIWAEGGKLFAGYLNTQGLTQQTQLCDFNPMTFKAISAPY